MNDGLLQITGPVVFFPVRHHSPACARVLRQLIEEIVPAKVLIEGPSDYNPYLAELSLPHQLPIAIYSYVRREDGARSGAYYPFCVYSPEWQAIQTAQRLSIPFAFIDLPWEAMLAGADGDAEEKPPAQRYADGELRTSDYVAALCRKLGVEDFDTLWDTLFEIDPTLTPAVYLERAHQLCGTIRASESHVPAFDIRREAYMAEQIRQARAGIPGNARVLVVTGGFHSSALYERLHEGARSSEDTRTAATDSIPVNLNTRDRSQSDIGIALTPYSYERLDSLTGYEAGMPNPGFYHRIWEMRNGDAQVKSEAISRSSVRMKTQQDAASQLGPVSSSAPYRSLLAEVATELRGRKQSVSAADLIAVETMARGLATLRAHSEVWRMDLIDGIVAALVKDEIEGGIVHPFLQALYMVFRGKERGVLAAGTSLPPLVADIQRLLVAHDLMGTPDPRTVELDLHQPEDRERSRVLHCLRLLELTGYLQTGGTDFTSRSDLVRLWESWRVRWSPEFEGGCIEASVYGPILAEAAANRIGERVRAAERDAEVVALALLDAAQLGEIRLIAAFHPRLVGLIREESDFFRLCRALGHLLYLFRYDEAFGTAGDVELGRLLSEAFSRGLWLLESLGQIQGMEREQVEALRTLVETCARCPDALPAERSTLVEVLRRTSQSATHLPLIRGAAAGALWTLGEQDIDSLLEQMTYFADPSHLGDYLTGLFSLARETAQRQPELVLRLDSLLMGYDEHEFLEALPSLRLAFSFFTPREKHYLARTLMEARHGADVAPLPALNVDAETAARVLALEAKLAAVIAKYGLRGGVR